MRFTSKDLAKVLGLKIGYRIRFSNGEIAKITEDYELDFYPWKASLCVLVDEEYEISPRKEAEELGGINNERINWITATKIWGFTINN